MRNIRVSSPINTRDRGGQGDKLLLRLVSDLLHITACQPIDKTPPTPHPLIDSVVLVGWSPWARVTNFTTLSTTDPEPMPLGRCVWEKRSTGIAGEEEWGWSCKEQEGKTRTDVVRGGAIYLVDSASMYARLGCGVRTRQLQAQADELKGRVEGARELLIVMGRDLPEAARYEARRVVSRWEVQLGERAEQLRGAAAADRALGDEGGVAGRLEAQRLRFSVRIDEGSLDAAGLFSVNHVKFRPVGAGGGGGGDGMPPPVPPRRRGGKQTFETVGSRFPPPHPTLLSLPLSVAAASRLDRVPRLRFQVGHDTRHWRLTDQIADCWHGADCWHLSLGRGGDRDGEGDCERRADVCDGLRDAGEGVGEGR